VLIAVLKDPVEIGFALLVATKMALTRAEIFKEYFILKAIVPRIQD